MQCKTGAEHLHSLKDGRSVYIDGNLVRDVTTHPAYRNAVGSAALLYDFQARPENIELMTFMPKAARGGQPLLADAAELRGTHRPAQGAAGLGLGELRLHGPLA